MVERDLDDRDARQAAAFRSLEGRISDLRNMTTLLLHFAESPVHSAEAAKALTFGVVEIATMASNLYDEYHAGYGGAGAASRTPQADGDSDLAAIVAGVGIATEAASTAPAGERARAFRKALKAVSAGSLGEEHPNAAAVLKRAAGIIKAERRGSAAG